MKTYLQSIRYIQEILIKGGILALCILPPLLAFKPELLNPYMSGLYNTAHLTVFFVMIIRPLADITAKLPSMFGTTSFIRPLVILRKGFGIFSASIVVSFILSKIIMSPGDYFSNLLTIEYWSFIDYALLAHLADVTAVILLATSNNFSKRILGTWWKKVQKLSYVYFFVSALYVFLSFGDMLLLYYMIIIGSVTLIAYILNSRPAINPNAQTL